MNAAFDEIMDRYIQNMSEIFAHNLVGIYLTGSAATGDFIPGKSDVSICVVSLISPTFSQCIVINLVHRYFFKHYPHIQFSSRYLTRAQLSHPVMRTWPHYHYYHNKMHFNCHNIDYIQWYVLKTYGKTLFGTRISEFFIPASAEDVVRFICDEALPSWRSWLIKVLNHNESIHRLSLTDKYTMNSVCKIVQNHYFLLHRILLTKTQAAEHILTLAPPPFRTLLQDVLRIRQNKSGRLYAYPFQRRKDLIFFMEWMVEQLEQTLANQGLLSTSVKSAVAPGKARELQKDNKTTGTCTMVPETKCGA